METCKNENCKHTNTKNSSTQNTWINILKSPVSLVVCAPTALLVAGLGSGTVQGVIQTYAETRYIDAESVGYIYLSRVRRWRIHPNPDS